MKRQIHLLLLIFIVGVSACTASTSTPQTTAEITEAAGIPSTSSELSIITPMGEFLIAASRFVDEVNGVKPAPDQKLLLIMLTGPGGKKLEPGNFSLEDFQAMVQDSTQGTIHILGDDGSKTISTMAGWSGPENSDFGMGFRLQDSVTSYQLIWPGNDPINIFPTE